jgi:hypothetical protein
MLYKKNIDVFDSCYSPCLYGCYSFLDAMVTNITIPFLVVVVTLVIKVVDVPVVTFAIVVAQDTSVLWLLWLGDCATWLLLCRHFLFCL